MYRFGKNLLIPVNATPRFTLHIHLSSTGWFLPGNTAARDANYTDPIHDKFIHTISSKVRRYSIHLDDGQKWDYYDPRTWGRIMLKEGWDVVHEHPYFKDYGPDWLEDSVNAAHALTAAKTRRRAKDVLCDQHVTAGLGNYLACEVLWVAGIHPHARWHQIPFEAKRELAIFTIGTIRDALDQEDERPEWGVFLRAGQQCKTCKDTIKYVKDTGGKRGSYYCPSCQQIGAPST